jgi:PhzF family phenazine biosynthesis protein
MRNFEFEVVNVFAQSTFGGNPLAVFPDAVGLTSEEMLSITEQFNLSETTFITPSSKGAARVRIFSPGYEMDFAGHPTLGSAYVVRERLSAGEAFALELNVGLVPVTAAGDFFELRSVPAKARAFEGSAGQVEAMLGLSAGAVAGTIRWVSCGSEQLLTPLRSPEDVAAARPVAREFFDLARNSAGQVMAYVFAPRAGGYVSRFFWEQAGAVREDAGTGSACANLGGYLNEEEAGVPSESLIEQGHAVKRLNVLRLRRDDSRQVYVGGRVVPLMRGSLTLP